MDLKAIPNPKDSNVYRTNNVTIHTTPSGSHTFFVNQFSINMLSLRDKTITQTLKIHGASTMDLKAIPNPKDSNVYRTNYDTIHTTPKRSQTFFVNQFSINMLSLQDKTITQTLKTHGASTMDLKAIPNPKDSNVYRKI